jgi:methionyl-tRNA formyltransferase
VLQATPLPVTRQEEVPPGTVVALGDGAAVVTGSGALRLEEVQLAGKRSIDINAFLRGQQGFVGSRLGKQLNQ